MHRFQRWLGVGVALGGLCSAALAQAVVPEDLEPPVFVPAQPRQEADEDRIQSAAMFSQGRLLVQREQPEEALRYYERAYRFSNDSQTVLTEVVQVAFRLGHLDEAARYALLVSEAQPLDPFMLRRLALHLSDTQQFEAAVRLYERALHAGEHDVDAADAAVISHFEMGRLHLLSQQFDKAADAFERLLPLLSPPAESPATTEAAQALLQDAPLTFAVMGEAFLRAGRGQRAAEMYGRALPDPQQGAQRAFHLARIAEQTHQPLEVLQQLEIYFQSSDRAMGVAPYRLLKDALQQLDRSAELIPRLTELRQRNNEVENPALTYSLAEAHLVTKNLDEATRLFVSLQDSQASVDADRGLILVALQQRQLDLLLQRLEDAVSRSGDLAPLAEAVQSIPQDPTLWPALLQAVREQHAAAAPPAAARAVAIAQIAAQAKQYEIADEFYGLAAGAPPQTDPEIGSRWAMDMLLGGRTQRAAQLLRLVLDHGVPAEQQGELWFYLSGALTLEKQYAEALTAARQAARLLPEIPAVESRPAWVQYLAQNWPAAEAEYRGFLERFAEQHGSTAVRSAVREAKLALSNIAVAQQRPAESEEWLEQVLDEFPDDIEAMNDLGYLWADRHAHLQRALRMTQRAVEADPDNPAYRDSHGWALYRLGRAAEAADELRKATAVDNPDGIILDHLAEVLQHTGDREGAKSAWQRALQTLQPADEARRKLIESKLAPFHSE